MNSPHTKLEERAVDLRRAFDRSFAEPVRRLDVHTENLLAIRLGDDPYALRLSEITGLFADKRVSAMPSGVRALLGIAGFRGAILPVYDLRILLGYAPSSVARWLVVAAKRPVAFAFDALDGHLRLARDAIATDAQAHHEHVGEIACLPEPRPIVRLASVLEAVERSTRDIHTKKEH
jgi:purine-binding chemotaxis protein CheW